MKQGFQRKSVILTRVEQQMTCPPRAAWPRAKSNVFFSPRTVLFAHGGEDQILTAEG